jgi:sulfur relay (sulfurtransferase) DsrF/TusC family protein
MQKIIYFIVFALLITLNSCKKEKKWDCINSTGKIIHQERILGGFNSIQIYDKTDVICVQDSLNPYKVDVEEGENLQSGISFQIIDSQLTISNKNTCHWVRNINHRTKLILSVKMLKKIEIYGDVNFSTKDTLRTGELIIEHYGGNDAHFTIKTNNKLVTAQHSAGNIYLSGEAAVQVNSLHDVSFLYAQNMIGAYCYVYHYGTGDAYVQPWKDFGVKSYYTGNVYYSREAWTKDIDIKGTGKVIKTQ